MQHRRRSTGIVVAALAALVTAGCGAQGEDSTTGGDAAVTASPVAGSSSPIGASPTDPSPAAATSSALPPDAGTVVTDPPVTLGPGHEAVVFVTYLEWDDAAAAVDEGSFVQGVVESTGTCTLTLTKGDQEVSASAPGEPDATTTYCGGLTVAGSRLSPGTWRAVVSYRSSHAHGASAATEVVVP